MKSKLTVLLALAAILWSCNDSLPAKGESKGSTGNEKPEKKEEKENKDATENKSTPQLLNDISIKEEGDVKVYRAFLAYESGEMVPKSNTTKPGEAIYATINIDKGWKSENGMVSLGATEKISTDDGTVILETDDLYPQPIEEINARFIQLKAKITGVSKAVNYFVVDFKIWDKKGDGVINGSYKFYVEQ